MSARSQRLRLALLGLVLAGASACDLLACDREPVAPAGDLDRLGHAVFLTPPRTGDPRSFVVVSNPEIQQLRVFDVLEGRFVAAPNVFFALSARTGQATRRLAVAATDHRWLFAVDGAGGFVQVLDMTADVVIDEDTVAPRFTTIAVAETAQSPSDVAVWIDEGGAALLFVTLPEQGALQVLSLDLEATEPEATQVALIDLGPGSVPARVAVDPTGDAVVVTDAALSSVAIVQVGDLAAPPRRLEVGGPSMEVAVGRLDPGDGMAPLALVSLRDRPVIAALRLFRPGYREDRYAILGSTEVPRPVTALYVPRQDRERPRPCCPLISREQTNPEAPTLAWGAVGTANGSLTYVRFDAPRGPFADAPPLGPSLVRLIDLDTPRPGALDDLESPQVWSPAGEVGGRPLLTVEPVDNYGDPPFFPVFSDLGVQLVYEGSPPGAAGRRGGLVLIGGEYALDLEPLAVPLEERDVLPGDAVQADISGRGGACPDLAFFQVSEVVGDTVFLTGVSEQEAACATLGEVELDLFASGDLLVRTEAEGYLGRLPLKAEPTAFAIPGFLVGVQAAPAGPPGRGSELSFRLTQGLTPALMQLSRFADFQAGGFGQSAVLPTAIVGGPANIRLSEGDLLGTTRMYVATGAGLLLEMEEATVSVDAIRSFR
jgi:hypothetical protein